MTPIREIDRRTIGAGGRGPITATLQKAFFDVVAGSQPKYQEWLDVPLGVSGPVSAPAVAAGAELG